MCIRQDWTERNVVDGLVGVELPPLNIALIKVHNKLAIVRLGAKDMVFKNKTAKKAEKYSNSS